jgi:lipopolysaccharide export system protein LptC
VSGEIGSTGGETTRLSADAGVYDSVAERMKLSNNVLIGGARFEVKLRSASIDFKTGIYQSDEPVEVHVGEGTTIVGDRATARNNGQEFIFEGHVRTLIIPPSDASANADQKRTNP